jgi:hypothetical protein
LVQGRSLDSGATSTRSRTIHANCDPTSAFSTLHPSSSASRYLPVLGSTTVHCTPAKHVRVRVRIHGRSSGSGRQPPSPDVLKHQPAPPRVLSDVTRRIAPNRRKSRKPRPRLWTTDSPLPLCLWQARNFASLPTHCSAQHSGARRRYVTNDLNLRKPGATGGATSAAPPPTPPPQRSSPPPSGSSHTLLLVTSLGIDRRDRPRLGVQLVQLVQETPVPEAEGSSRITLYLDWLRSDLSSRRQEVGLGLLSVGNVGTAGTAGIAWSCYEATKLGA